MRATSDKIIVKNENSIEDSKFFTVNSIPSYIVPDGFSIVDNGNSSYSVLNLKITTLPLSLFDIKGDLEYIDITINKTSTINGNFKFSDKGKKICIRKSHLNPPTADGSEFPNTILGRLAPITATLSNIVEGVSADIDFIPNQSGNLRAYIYTNYYEKLQAAINYCYYKGIQNIEVDTNGIIGIDIYDKGIYDFYNKGCLYIHSDVGHLEIKGKGKFKLVNELDDRPLYLFGLKQGNGDFGLKSVCLPPDEARYNIQRVSLGIANTGIFDGSAGNSIRTIDINNQKWDNNDVDGNDAFWGGIIGNSGGGIYDENAVPKRRNQVIKIKNCAVRSKNGGLGSFQNTGTAVQYFAEDVFVNYSNNYVGEPGRDFTNGDAWQDPCTWKFSGFTLINNVLTAPDNLDFSFEEYRKTLIDFEVTEVVSGVKRIISSITDAKTSTLATGIPDGTNLDIVITQQGRNYYGHKAYFHPTVEAYLKNVTTTKTVSKFKFYSDSGSVDGSLGEITVENCDIDAFQILDGSNGASVTETKVSIIDSTLKVDNLSGHVTIKNSDISGQITCKTLKTFGINKWDLTNSFVYEETDFSITGSSGSMELTFLAPYCVVNVNNHYFNNTFALPIAKNGTTNIVNPIFANAGEFLGLSSSRISENSTINLINSKEINGVTTSTLGISHEIAKINLINSNTIGNVRYPRPFKFDNTHKNVGMAEVTKDYFDYHVAIARGDIITGTGANFWNRYKEYNAGVFNPLESFYHILSTNEVSCLVGSFFKQKFTTPKIKETSIDDVDYHIYNTLMLTKGFIDIKFINGGKVNPFHKSTPTAFNSNLRGDTTFSNVVLRHIERGDGEVVRFLIDNKQARLIEVSSSVDRHYLPTIPTRLGLERERIYKDDNSGTYWDYKMTFEDISNTLYTGVRNDINHVDENNNILTTNTTIDISEHLSILQEKRDGTPLTPFSFSLIFDDDSESLFTHQTVHDYTRTAQFGIAEPNKDYTLWWWEFTYNGNEKRAFINNETGVITIDGILTETLKSTNNVRIESGYKIINKSWIETIIV